MFPSKLIDPPVERGTESVFEEELERCRAIWADRDEILSVFGEDLMLAEKVEDQRMVGP